MSDEIVGCWVVGLEVVGDKFMGTDVGANVVCDVVIGKVVVG